MDRYPAPPVPANCCPRCGLVNPPAVLACARCGLPAPSPARQWSAVAVVAVLAGALVLGLFLVSVVVISSRQPRPPLSSPPATERAAPAPVRESVYSYRVRGASGARRASLTFTTPDGSSSQVAEVALPWTHMAPRAAGQHLYVSAQNLDDAGSLTVEILRDGEIFRTARADGRFAIASASALVPR
jgi:hypothetical protein